MATKQYSVNNLVKRLTAALKSSIKKERVAEREAWWLLEKLTQQGEATLLIQESLMLTDEQQQVLDQWLRQRVDQKKPLQYILGSVPFCGLEILVEPPILIPRPETEEMVWWLIEAIKESGRAELNILDLCTGSGCIGLALAAAFPKAHVVGVDLNPAALVLAEKNKHYLSVRNITFVQSDLYKSLDSHKKFDLIISNPPYLSSACYQQVSDEIRLWEDKNALVADHDGMALYEKIVSGAHDFLKTKELIDDPFVPQLIFEIGQDQDSIELLFFRYKFKKVRVMNDMQGLRRWVIAYV